MGEAAGSNVGLPESIRGEADVDLLDKYVPNFSFREQHSCEVAASSGRVMQAAAAYRPDDDRMFGALIALRELPGRLLSRSREAKTARPPAFGLHNFTLLEFVPSQALAYGLVGRFWRLNFGLVPITDHMEFQEFAEPGVPKLVLGISASEIGGRNLTRLTTETRVFCPDTRSLALFSPYWYLIRPFSGLIRRRILNSIKAESERRGAVA